MMQVRWWDLTNQSGLFQSRVVSLYPKTIIFMGLPSETCVQVSSKQLKNVDWPTFNNPISFWSIDRSLDARNVFKLHLGRGGGQVVSVLAFYSHDPSSNPAAIYSFSLKFVFEKNENNQKGAGVGPFKKIIMLFFASIRSPPMYLRT